MNNEKIIISIVFLMMAFTPVFGQNLPDSKIFSNHLPPSPNAASINKFSESEVDLYTGKANINIPIYNFKSGDITIPISLSYNTKGIKVSDEASWVGLGWSLNCGGVISRVINGKDDFHTRGYVLGDELPATGNGMLLDYYLTYRFDNPDDITKLELYHNGTDDAQPDDFYFSFLGFSGELFFEKGSAKACLVDQSSNLEFNYDFESNTWVVLDNSGWKYYFEKHEISRSLTQTSSIPPPSPSGTYSEEAISAWYLTRITTPKGDHVTLEYKETGKYIQSVVDYTELTEYGPYTYTDFDLNDRKGLVISELEVDSYTASINEVNEVYLDKISGNEGEIIFDTDERLDRKNTLYASAAQRLENILIYKLNGELFKKFQFNYSYFNLNYLSHNDKENYLRLKLISLQEYGWNNNYFETISPYLFYYNSIELPAKNAFSIDLWGYFNNSDPVIKNYHHIQLSDIYNGTTFVNQFETNSINTKIPRVLYFGDNSSNFTNIFLNGANRAVNPNTIEASILKKIVYPTGGITEFLYEPNTYSGNNIKCDTEITFNTNSSGYSVHYFSIQDPGAFLLMQLNMHLNIPHNPGVYDQMEASVSVKNQQGEWKKFIKFLPTQEPTNSLISNIHVMLEPGDYRVETSSGNISQMHISLDAKLLSQVSCDNINADGLRVKEILNYDKNYVLANSQLYEYTFDGISSGINMSPFEFIINQYDLFYNNYTYRQPCCLLGSIYFPFDCHTFINIGSTSFSNVSHAAKGNQIGYSKVLRRQISSEEQNSGYSMFYFVNEPTSYQPVRLPYYPGVKNLKNGIILKEEHYNNNKDTVYKKTYNYSNAFGSNKSVMGLITLKNNHEFCQDPLLVKSVVGQVYYKISDWWFLERILEEKFDLNGQKTISSEINYKYNPLNRLPSQITNSYLEGLGIKEVSQKIKYVGDYSVYVLPFFKNLIDNHILDKKIKIEKIENDFLVDGKLTRFTDFGEPEIEYIYENPVISFPEDHNASVFLQQNYNPKREFSYSHGSNSALANLVSLKEKNNLSNSIDWGYAYSKPISFTINSTSMESLHTSFENNESNDWSLYSENTILKVDGGAHTGEYVVKTNSNAGPFKTFLVGLEAEKHPGYTASVWVKGGSGAFIHIEVDGNWSTHVRKNNVDDPQQWNLIEIEIPKSNYESLLNSNLTFKVYVGGDANALWDDIRFHPSDASMTTYTYAPLIGTTSQSDANNLPTYYEYDAFGRLKYIRDHKRNILKTFEYNYAH